ncbi:hypothetical protein [Sphingorhabdus sp.]|jgi:hypothetical protein|uniref:hypothetical protein n=1 Tax=Sphingorhabdus sp. TaxID=1902408 RepID=UPI0037C876AC
MRGTITIENIEYDLTHLNPFTIDVTPRVPDAPTYKVLVSFGHHTFTRAFDTGTDRVEYLYCENNDERCFCPDRHLSSKNLRGLIAYHSNGKAYFSQRRNYMLLDQPLGGVPYAVFFNLERATNIAGVDATMFVVSAHPRDNLPARNRIPSMSYATLLSKTVRGEQIVPPKK